MEGGEMGFEGVGVGEGESLFVKRADEVQNVERPAAHYGAKVCERTDLRILFSREFAVCRFTVGDQRNARIRRNLGQQDVAANPSGASCGGRERLSFFDGRNGKCKFGYEKNVSYAPTFNIVMESDEIWCFVFTDFSQHRRVCGVQNLAAE